MSYQPVAANPEGEETPDVVVVERALTAAELLVSWEPAIENPEVGIQLTPKSSQYPLQLSPIDISQKSVDLEEAKDGRNTPEPSTPLSMKAPVRREIVRRYSEADLSTAEIVEMANKIFSVWDREDRGYLAREEIELPNLDDRFTSAIGRVLALHSPVIHVDHLIECISVLENGDLPSKVKLLMQFLDEDGNYSVSYKEIQVYLKGFDDGFLRRLGLNAKSGHDISYEELLSMFESSDRGLEAVNIFCHQILRLLVQSAQEQQHQRHNTILSPGGRALGARQASRRQSLSNAAFILEPSPSTASKSSSPPFLTAVSTFCTSSYQKFLKKRDEAVRRLQQLSHVEYFKIALVLLQIMFWLINFFYYRSHDKPYAFAIAKGFGLNLRVLSIFIYATMARTTMGQLYTIPFLRPFIPLGINIEVHSFIGYCIALHMFGHTFGHIAYQTMYTSGFQNAFTQNSLLRGNNWEEKMKGDGKTGFLLITFVLVMGLTALFRSFSSRQYLIFNIVHYFYLLYLPMLFLHVPTLWPYFVAIGGLMILERFYDLYQKTTYTTLSYSRPCHNGVTFLSVPRYGKMSYPGSYYRIKIPALSMHEWHPFSLAGGTTSHHLTFFIASAGDWCRELHKLVSDPNLRQSTIVQVQGPFLAPASQALVRKPGGKILCVASGIGITPFFSVMSTKVTTEVSYENDRMLYHALFEETRDRNSRRNRKGRDEPQGLLQVLQSTRQKRRTVLEGTTALKEDVTKDKDSSNNSTHNNDIQAAKKEGTEGDVSGDIEQGRIELPDRATTSSNDLSPSLSNSTLIQETNTGKVDESDEQDSMVKVVWSIRDSKELSFYLDYVHHLVKSQEQLNQHFYQRGVPKRILLSEEVVRSRRHLHNHEGGKESDQTAPQKQRNAVEVEVYLTGLGNRSDPVYMLSQALFLLSIANKSSSYMKIHFGRPDLKKIVSDFKPEEVYYCGGSALKDNLQKVCNDSHIPFHPEDFDAGGGGVVKAIYKIATKLLPSFLFPAESRPRKNSQGGKGKGSGRQPQTGKASH